MPFSRPTLDALVTRSVADVEAELQNGAAYIPGTLERATAIAFAGLAHSQHGHLAWAARQLIIDTAEDEHLVRWAGMFLPGGRKPATKAEFTILATGALAEAPIPSGTRYVRADGAVFETLAAAELPASEPFEVEITVRAIDVGSAGNTVPGSTLTLESPVSDIDPAATVQGSGSDPIGGGADMERIEDLRARLLEHLQDPPKGGAAGDYAKWAKEVPGITRAWELPLQLGPSTVLVLVVQDTFDADGFYDDTNFAPDVAAVQDYIDERAPVTAIPTVQAPVEQAIDFEINISPNTVEVQEQIRRELEDLFLREAAPNGTLKLSKIREAISKAQDEDFHDLVSPAADVVSSATQLPTVGAISWGDA